MYLRQSKVVHLKVHVAQIVMRFEMTRVVLKTVGEAVERFGRPSLLRFENSQVAVCVSHAILRGNGFEIKIGSSRIFSLIQQ